MIVVAVNDQSRRLDMSQVLGHVDLREGFDAILGPLQTDLHAPQPEAVAHPLRDHRASRGEGAGRARLSGSLQGLPGDAKYPLTPQWCVPVDDASEGARCAWSWRSSASRTAGCRALCRSRAEGSTRSPASLICSESSK